MCSEFLKPDGRLLPALLALLLTGAACTSSPEGADPGSSPGGSPATGSQPSASPSPPPQVSDLAVVVGPEAVAGWWDGTEWVQSHGDLDTPVLGGETYDLIGLSGVTGRAVGSAPHQGCEISSTSIDIDIPGLERSFSAPLDQTKIALTGVQDPVPRAVEVLPPSATYVDAAREALAEEGAEVAKPTVVQVVRADLNGDGRNEVVVTAEAIADRQGLFAQEGDYSITFLRSVVDEQVVTTVLDASVADPQPGETPFIESYRLVAVADLNGDGVMELAVAGKYYEGASVVFHEFGSNGGADEVLFSACGA